MLRRGLMLLRGMMILRGLMLLRGPMLLHGLMLLRGRVLLRGLMQLHGQMLLHGLLLLRGVLLLPGLLLLRDNQIVLFFCTRNHCTQRLKCEKLNTTRPRRKENIVPTTVGLLVHPRYRGLINSFPTTVGY